MEVRVLTEVTNSVTSRVEERYIDLDWPASLPLPVQDDRIDVDGGEARRIARRIFHPMRDSEPGVTLVLAGSVHAGSGPDAPGAYVPEPYSSWTVVEHPVEAPA